MSANLPNALTVARIAAAIGQPGAEHAEEPRDDLALVHVTLVPIDTMLEKPTSLLFAQSRIAVRSAPDCDTKAMLPVFAPPLLNVAFRPMDGRMTPRQFGPIRRIL